MSDPKKKIDTSSLEESMNSTINLSAFLKENDTSFSDDELPSMLQEIISDNGLSKASVAKRAHMSEVYLFQILSGRRRPSRDRILCLCVGLQMSLADTRALLKRCRYPELYIKERRDAIIMFGLKEGWDVDQINDALYDEGEETLV